MEYNVTKKSTDHTIRLSEEDIVTAVREWLDKNSKVNVPKDTRIWLSEYNTDYGGSEVRGRISWNT